MGVVVYEYGGAGAWWMDYYLTLTAGNLSSGLTSPQYYPEKGQPPMLFCKI